MGVRDMDQFLERWEMDVPGVRRRMILAPVPRERERWYGPVASDPRLDRSGYRRGTGTGPPHHWTVVGRLRRGWAHSLDIRAVRWCPPALEAPPAAPLRGAVQELPANSGIGLANWNWKVVCQYVSERFGISLSRSTCLNYLRRLGFSFKRPKKRLLKADMEKR